MGLRQILQGDPLVQLAAVLLWELVAQEYLLAGAVLGLEARVTESAEQE